MRAYGKRLAPFLIIGLLIITFASPVTAAGSKKVLYGEIEGSISPAQVHLVEDIVSKAQADDYDIILIRLDTPGGLGKAMRNIVKAMLSSPVPVCIWVGPEGAHAASAGAFIVAAGVVSSMAPGTNLGSAIPVASGGDDLPDSMSAKVKNDFSSFIKSIARKRGRNQEWYAKAVEEGVSVDAQEAVLLNVVNMIATSPDDFIMQIGSKGLVMDGEVVHFKGSEVVMDYFDPGLRYSILSWLLDPQVAYFLLMGGIIGIFFELSHPGTILPGVIGGFSLLTALYAMSILPTSAAGLMLLIFGGVLFVLEIFIVSYGLLSVAAVISLFVGSLVLFRGGEVYQIPLATIISTVLTFSAFAGALIYLVTKSQLSHAVSGQEGMSGLEGVVTYVGDDKIKVRVRGEIWNALPPDSGEIRVGDRIMVDEAEGLMLKVRLKS